MDMFQACSIRSSKLYSNIAVQTDDVIIHDEGMDDMTDDVINSPGDIGDETPLFDGRGL